MTPTAVEHVMINIAGDVTMDSVSMKHFIEMAHQIVLMGLMSCNLILGGISSSSSLLLLF